ncbi:hypothetical protein BC832DRAFT_365526 [Gaertneriomyces semiglobifer]|nr:hypothetical protein BC832DRAFT_365526 [Gaertneriomyces semiglobifer]
MCEYVCDGFIIFSLSGFPVFYLVQGLSIVHNKVNYIQRVCDSTTKAPSQHKIVIFMQDHDHPLPPFLLRLTFAQCAAK